VVAEGVVRVVVVPAPGHNIEKEKDTDKWTLEGIDDMAVVVVVVMEREMADIGSEDNHDRWARAQVQGAVVDLYGVEFHVVCDEVHDVVGHGESDADHGEVIRVGYGVRLSLYV
jgi:hypothetical protein